MALVETFLAEIETLKATAAIEALSPADDSKTEFGFGRACGIQEGLQMVGELLNKLIAEKDRDEADRFSRKAR